MASTGDIQLLFRGSGREELVGEKCYSQACLVTIKHPGSSCKASHKSNPLYVPQGYAEISNLHHVGGSNRCGADSL